MAVSVAEVKKIAGLARLNPEGAELEKLAHDFNGILDFVAQINEVDAGSAQKMDHPLGVINADRKDIPEASIDLAAIKKFAPKFESGFFVVPRVIETDE